MGVHSAVGEVSVNETAQKWARSTGYWEVLI